MAKVKEISKLILILIFQNNINNNNNNMEFTTRDVLY